MLEELLAKELVLFWFAVGGGRHFDCEGFLGDLGRGDGTDTGATNHFFRKPHCRGLLHPRVAYEDDVEVRIEGQMAELEPKAFAGEDRKRGEHRPNVVFEWRLGAFCGEEVVRDEGGIFHRAGKDSENRDERRIKRYAVSGEF